MRRDFELFPVPSLSAIADKVGTRPMAVAYLSRARNKIIVSPMTTPTVGMYVETQPITPLPWETTSEVLGQCIWETLLRFRAVPHLGSSGSGKKTEWPAYQASGSKTVRAFEEDFVRCSI